MDGLFSHHRETHELWRYPKGIETHTYLAHAQQNQTCGICAVKAGRYASRLVDATQRKSLVLT
jgi:hypothetical protein